MKEREARSDVRLAIRLKYPDRDSFVERFAVNLSRSGVFLRTPTPLPEGSRVHFEYRLSDGQRILRGRGIVRWSRDEPQSTDADPPGMGIEFVDLDATSEALVDEIVSSHGDGARAPQRLFASASSSPPVIGHVHAPPAPMAMPQVGMSEGEDTALDAIDALGEAPVSPATAGTNPTDTAPEELNLTEDEFVLALELGQGTSRLSLVTALDIAKQRTVIGGLGDTEGILIERFAAQIAVSAEELCHEIDAIPTMLHAFILDGDHPVDERITQALQQRFPDKIVNGRLEGKKLIVSAISNR